MPATYVIIVAAGSGLRFGAPLPKQFCLLDGRPVVMTTIDALRHHLPDAHITLVISPDMDATWRELCHTYNFCSPVTVHGGASRWESIHNALQTICLSGSDDDSIVMVHDGVRPLVSGEMLERLNDALSSDSTVHGAIPAIAVTDSIRRIGSDGSSEALDRSSLRAVQTPQAFRARLLLKAYELPYSENFTDDASVMEAAGYSHLALTEGDRDNIKITNPGDIEVASLILSRRQGK